MGSERFELLGDENDAPLPVLSSAKDQYQYGEVWINEEALTFQRDCPSSQSTPPHRLTRKSSTGKQDLQRSHLSSITSPR